jgi:hypothetical protein
MSFVNYGHQEEFEFTRRFWFDVSEVWGSFPGRLLLRIILKCFFKKEFE